MAVGLERPPAGLRVGGRADVAVRCAATGCRRGLDPDLPPAW